MYFKLTTGTNAFILQYQWEGMRVNEFLNVKQGKTDRIVIDGTSIFNNKKGSLLIVTLYTCKQWEFQNICLSVQVTPVHTDITVPSDKAR